MTYISRRTRVADSRWLDEVNAVYTLRAVRKRSDGRLKRHSSCDDLRGWINNNCIKHEYLVDLMSDGELMKKSHIRLFGRFIPVSVLVDVLKNVKSTEKKHVEYKETAPEKIKEEPKERIKPTEPKKPIKLEEPEEAVQPEEIGARRAFFEDDENIQSNENKNNVSFESVLISTIQGLADYGTKDEESKVLDKVLSSTLPPNSDTASNQISQADSKPISDKKENKQLEEMLYECMNLLCKALRKLEKIDAIVRLAQGDFENVKNEEIQNALQKSKPCFIDCFTPSKTNSDQREDNTACPGRKISDSARYKELLRKVSGLREKLKKIEEERQKINQQIFMSQQRVNQNCTSPNQVTELYNRKERALVNQLEACLEKLIAEKGKLLCKMCSALNSLNILKKSSKMSVCSPKKSLKVIENSTYQGPKASLSCTCGCQMSDNFESSESDRILNSHSSAESYLNECSSKWRKANNTAARVSQNFNQGNISTKNIYCRPIRDNQTEESRAFVSLEFTNPKNENVRINIPRRNVCSDSSTFRNKSARMNDTIDCDCLKSSNFKEESTKRCHSNERFTSASAPGFYKRSSQNHQTKIPCFAEEPAEDQSNASKPVKKSNLKIVCPHSCNKKNPCGSMINFRVCFRSDCKDVGVSDSKTAARRPNTSPTTNEEFLRKANHEVSKDELREYVPERKIKSETTMQEVEKALRNYEERLNNVSNLESRVEELRQMVSEAKNCKKQLAKKASELQKIWTTEAEKSANETTRLCSENWELKRRFQQLAKRFEMQCKKIESLKINLRRASELEMEAESLKKELLGYQGNFNQQQKCINRLHSVVAVQRTEIEKLMYHIRKLTAMREQSSVASYPERKNAQKSRSYSPDSGKNKRSLKSKSQGIRGSRDSGGMRGSRDEGEIKPSDEEVTPCFCPDNQLRKRSNILQPPVQVIHCYPPQANQANQPYNWS